MKALVLWEVSKKQQYIFSSNKLKENKGASYIIKHITENLPYEVDKKYENKEIYSGGGSSIYDFDTVAEAKEFIKNLSKKVISTYPGIELFMVIQEYEDDRFIAGIIDEAYKKLAIKKNKRENSPNQLSFGFERICESTGLPAGEIIIDPDGEKRYVSHEIKVKDKNSKKSNKDFEKLLAGYETVNEFRELVDSDKSYIALVHIDGNQMGKKLNSLKDKFVKSEDIKETNKRYLNELKTFSDDIKKAYQESFKKMVEVIKENISESDLETLGLPVIPIIISGDDVTYVTNGKLGIESARVFLQELNQHKIKIGDTYSTLNACAGVAITRVSHQFYRAYELAENLCSNAKKVLLKEYSSSIEDKDYSLIDWHIEQGDIIGSIDEIRQKNYIALDNKNLTMRPLYVNNGDSWRTYDNFLYALNNILHQEINKKTVPRSKLKKLREYLRKGELETQYFLEVNRLSNYFPALENAKGDYCFYENTCMYFDAIEAMDIFKKLK